MSIFISKQLKYFMVAMEKKCISKAADELYLTRTPLCKKLADLENALGETLFIRKYNELVPTEYAVSLYKELTPIYEAQSRLENKLNNKGGCGTITIVFDVTVPELMYRTISSSIEGEITQVKVKFQRVIITEKLLQDNAYINNIFFISLRPLVLCYPFKEVKWHGGEVTILMPKSKMNATDFIDIYMWNDGFSSHFKDRIETALKNKYESVSFILHNFDFSTILHRIYRGKGACILPLKTALIYKSESLAVKPIKERKISVFMYHNEGLSFKEGFERTKQVLLSFI